MDKHRCEVLLVFGGLLSIIGSANDAEDHGYCDDAERMRQESCESMQRLLTEHAFLGAHIPSIDKELNSGHFFDFGWANLKCKVEELLQSSARGQG